MKRKFVGILTLVLALGSGITVSAETVTGMKSLNNYERELSYKVSPEHLKQIYGRIPRSSMFLENLEYNPNQNLQGLSPELSYLVENNILSTDVAIQSNGVELNINHNSYGNSFIRGKDTRVTRSDFLMGLAKASYGVQMSRPIIFTSKSEREIDGKLQGLTVTSNYKPIGYKGDDTQFDFSEGDYIVYYTPNIYEIYFKTLLDKGIISLSSFKDINFQNEYSSYGKSVSGVQQYPRWATELGIYSPFKPIRDYANATILTSKPLGSGFSVPAEDNRDTETALKSYSLSRVEPNFFMNENITTIEALRYVESILKTTEKTITDTEAKIITYKYGLNYINKFADSDRSTIMFLIAKGVINFEDPSEIATIYNSLTQDYFIKLLYRVHNKNARTNFSEVQLTDSDNFWLQKGFGQVEIEVYETDFDANVYTQVISSEPISKGSNSWFGKLLNSIKSLAITGLNKVGVQYVSTGVHYRDNNTKEFTIVRLFSKNTKYKYMGKPVSELQAGDGNGTVQTVGTVVGANGTNSEITFKINAVNEASALAILDSNTQIDAVSLVGEGSLTGVSRVKEGNKESIYISANNITKISSEIKILNDKHLKNIYTGAEALLLQDNKVALVGNEVIVTDELFVFGVNNEIYYNLDIITALMSNAYLSQLYPGSIFKTHNLDNEKFVKVKSEDGSEIGGTIIANFKGMSADNGTKEDKLAFNLTHTTRGTTALIKDYSYYEGSSSSSKRMIKLIVEWEYVIPTDKNTLKTYVPNPNATVQDISKFVYTRPADSELATWWDSNLEISNALVNLIYETTGVTYVKSGYLTPKVTLLSDLIASPEIRNKVFGNLQLSSTYRTKFMEGADTSEFHAKLFNQAFDGNSLSGQLRPARTYTEITATTTGGNGNYRDFAGKFAVTPGNSVYKTLDYDTMTTYNESEKTLYMRTRNNAVSVEADKKIVTFEGKKYYVSGYSNSGATMRLTALDKYYEGTVYKAGDGSLRLRTNNGDMLDLMTQEYKGITQSKYNIINSKEFAGIPLSSNLIQTNYLSGNSVVSVQMSSGSVSDISMVNNPVGQRARVHPIIHLNRGEYFVTEDNKIVKHKTVIEAQANVFYSGINSSIIDSIVAEVIGYEPITSLENGDKVLVGDTMYVVNGSNLVSYPIKNPSIISKLRGTNLGDTAIKPILLSYYSSLNVQAAGRTYPFTSYITEIGLGPAKAVATYNKTLIKDGPLRITTNGSTTNYVSGDRYESIVIKLKLSSDILVKPIDSSLNTYSVVMNSKRGSEGYIDNIPFFTESLGLDISDELFLTMGRSNFAPLKSAQELVNKFKSLYNSALKGDVKAIFKLVSVSLLTYMIVSSWISFMIINYKLMYSFFQALKYPFRDSDKKGIDIIKIFSLGMYDIDTKVSVPRLIGGNLLMFILLFVVIDVL